MTKSDQNHSLITNGVFYVTFHNRRDDKVPSLTHLNQKYKKFTDGHFGEPGSLKKKLSEILYLSYRIYQYPDKSDK